MMAGLIVKEAMILEVERMIGMGEYEYIRLAHRVHGRSIRQIQRETGHDRKTIRKALEGEALKYAPRAQQPYPVLGAYREVIDQWLREDKEEPKKQRHTARRIYHRLVGEYGFQGSESAIRHYVREARVRLGVGNAQVFIPLDPECGQEAEVDWGNGVAYIKGVRTGIKFLCMRSRYSGKHFVRAYLCERQQAFFDAHIHAFSFFGGIFPTLVYDNLSSAIKDILRGRQRIEQESFVKFRSYYTFGARFCNVNSGHEKGGVEGMVGYVRRNYLVPIPCVENLEELNQRLLTDCLAFGDHRISGRDRTVNELFEHERQHLLRLPAVAFSNIQTRTGKINPYSTLLVDKNHYSAPARFVGFTVHINLGIDRIDIFWDGKKIATHPRVFGNNKWQLDPQHYLEVIRQRPGSFQTARPILQWRQVWPGCLEKLLERFQKTQGETDGIKDFISVLMLYRDHRADEVQAAIELALENHISSSEGVKHILLHSGPDTAVSAPLSNWPATITPNVTVYGQLGGVR
jgi:transposase